MVVFEVESREVPYDLACAEHAWESKDYLITRTFFCSIHLLLASLDSFCETASNVKMSCVKLYEEAKGGVQALNALKCLCNSVTFLVLGILALVCGPLSLYLVKKPFGMTSEFQRVGDGAFTHGLGEDELKRIAQPAGMRALMRMKRLELPQSGQVLESNGDRFGVIRQMSIEGLRDSLQQQTRDMKVTLLLISMLYSEEDPIEMPEEKRTISHTADGEKFPIVATVRQEVGVEKRVDFKGFTKSIFYPVGALPRVTVSYENRPYITFTSQPINNKFNMPL